MVMQKNRIFDRLSFHYSGVIGSLGTGLAYASDDIDFSKQILLKGKQKN